MSHYDFIYILHYKVTISVGVLFLQELILEVDGKVILRTNVVTKMSEISDINSSVEFWVVGVMISVVTFIGFIGNFICILMFKFKRLNINKTFASLLSWLAVIDSVFLVSSYMITA